MDRSNGGGEKKTRRQRMKVSSINRSLTAENEVEINALMSFILVL